ncbi:hypothetical protein CAPTEDRAFT_130369 [Capitella teleta]|uniref:Carbonic anhydrase n=1 Tax=Capitella teleta TaxID=283909 RepID=R7TR34_CAPTE|nr:hypothetical protein CAPTEDRAFT_130369 [Capitella teleta]|eukprot:ELT96119.1 hypothetical protein CAPTEDRAFT_130369 [Capitella teleta]
MLPTETSEWASKFPEASGERQSPIDILSRDAIFDPRLQQRPLLLNYVMCRETDVCNNGHTSECYATFIQLHRATAVSGGPFEAGHEYELTEFRFHWGKGNDRGSEHTVNSKAFPMELHLIHYNVTLYSSFEEAVGQPNGVSIIGLLVQVGKEHAGLKIITDQLEDIQYKGRQKTITSAFNPVCLLPDEMLRDFWSYNGSFTSPPCTEEVTWVMFRYPLTISFNQIEEFRRLRTHHKGELPPPEEDGALVDNFRPTQPVNGRRIVASFMQ